MVHSIHMVEALVEETSWLPFAARQTRSQGSDLSWSSWKSPRLTAMALAVMLRM
jgi:hypothetical protein